jgi:SagB-type dehydrogenase family enzyme
MDEARVGRRFGFFCAPLEDPRRIELRQGRYLEAYRRRGADEDIIEIGHDLTKLRRANDSDMADALAVFQQPHMYPIEYTQDREYPLQSSVLLPPATIPDCLFSELVRGRRSSRDFGRRPLTLAELSTLLFCAVGETGRFTVNFEDDRPIEASLRSIPSGGALHPTRLYTVVLQLGDLDPGLYHYDTPEHTLECVKPFADPEIEALLAAFPIHPGVVDLTRASAIFFVTTKFWRTRAKYGPRGYRYCLQEAGSACQNLSLAAVALGLAHVVLGGFYDDEIHSSLELDGVDHAVITAIAVGAPSALPESEPRHVEL